MKKCGYCGRENSDEVAYCGECGTRLSEPDAPATASHPRDRTWMPEMGRLLTYVILILGIGLLYLLSFGPVEHYCGTVTSQTTAPTTVVVNGQTTVLTSVRKVSYPGWVGILYRPAFVLRGNALYGRYLQWWEEH